MSHIAIYREYRPQTFDDVVDQEHITNILKEQIKTKKIFHAYIFSGTRGVGKTSTAKVFARAINCLEPVDGEPCNKCAACQSILEGKATDVVEMDAASNNSVDNIRAIRQEVSYASTSLKYKVYIIDEAHMLSSSAFNALLKTLEEPPEGVIFILATTEEQKIIPTILSRCIRFEFKKISIEAIVKRLEKVLCDRQIKYENSAIEYIAKLSDGGLRDALSILERCIGASNETLTFDRVQDIVGVVDKELINKISYSILTNDIVDTALMADKILSKGKDLRYCISQIISTMMDCLICIASDNFENLRDDIIPVLKNCHVSRLNKIIKGLSRLDENIKVAPQPSILFKAKMLELASEVLDSPIDSNVNARIERLEQQLKMALSGTITEKVKAVANAKEEKTYVEKQEKTDQVQITSKPKEFKLTEQILKKASEMDNLRLYSALSDVSILENENGVEIIASNGFAYEILRKKEMADSLKDILTSVTDKEYNIQIRMKSEEPKEDKTSEFETMFKDSGVPFTIID